MARTRAINSCRVAAGVVCNILYSIRSIVRRAATISIGHAGSRFLARHATIGCRRKPVGPVILRNMTVAVAEAPQGIIRWPYLWWALAALAGMVGAIVLGNLWFLNFVHVFSSLLWTGVDLFMGFVLGPIMRQLDMSARRDIVRRLTPRTLFLMPTVSIISGTTGWFLAVDLGYTTLPWPAFAWVAAALVLVTLMTILGLGFLTPVNVLVCLELQKERPDLARIGYWMQRYFYAVAAQGTMQVAIIIVMTRFRAGV
jgi:hypothetical protein